MARQTFTKGQTIYVRGYSDHYRKAIVIKPDVIQPAYKGLASRHIHYVMISYFDMRAGKFDMTRGWSVLNNRRQIITEEAHAEIEHGNTIGKLHNGIRTHQQVEKKFALYVDQAKLIMDMCGPLGAQEAIAELALYLHGLFDFAPEYRRQTPEHINQQRADTRAAAEKAQEALRELGEKVPELD